MTFPKFKVLLLSQSVNGQLFNSKNKGDCQLWSVVVISHTDRDRVSGRVTDRVRVRRLDSSGNLVIRRKIHNAPTWLQLYN